MSNTTSAASQNPPQSEQCGVGSSRLLPKLPSGSLLFTSSSTPQKPSKGKERANDDMLALDLHTAEERVGMNGDGNPYSNGGYHQMQLMEQQASLECPHIRFSTVLL